MSVTRSLYFARIFFDWSISSELKSVMFLFHIPRSSIQFRPKSCEATKQARSKSCEISSLITDKRKGHSASARATLGAAASTPMAPTPATNSRRDADIGILLGDLVRAGNRRFNSVSDYNCAQWIYFLRPLRSDPRMSHGKADVLRCGHFDASRSPSPAG